MSINVEKRTSVPVTPANDTLLLIKAPAKSYVDAIMTSSTGVPYDLIDNNQVDKCIDELATASSESFSESINSIIDQHAVVHLVFTADGNPSLERILNSTVLEDIPNVKYIIVRHIGTPSQINISLFTRNDAMGSAYMYPLQTTNIMSVNIPAIGIPEIVYKADIDFTTFELKARSTIILENTGELWDGSIQVSFYGDKVKGKQLTPFKPVLDLTMLVLNKIGPNNVSITSQQVLFANSVSHLFAGAISADVDGALFRAGTQYGTFTVSATAQDVTGGTTTFTIPAIASSSQTLSNEAFDVPANKFPRGGIDYEIYIHYDGYTAVGDEATINPTNLTKNLQSQVLDMAGVIWQPYFVIPVNIPTLIVSLQASSISSVLPTELILNSSIYRFNIGDAPNEVLTTGVSYRNMHIEAYDQTTTLIYDAILPAIAIGDYDLSVDLSAAGFQAGEWYYVVYSIDQPLVPGYAFTNEGATDVTTAILTNAPVTITPVTDNNVYPVVIGYPYSYNRMFEVNTVIPLVPNETYGTVTIEYLTLVDDVLATSTMDVVVTAFDTDTLHFDSNFVMVKCPEGLLNIDVVYNGVNEPLKLVLPPASWVHAVSLMLPVQLALNIGSATELGAQIYNLSMNVSDLFTDLLLSTTGVTAQITAKVFNANTFLANVQKSWANGNTVARTTDPIVFDLQTLANGKYTLAVSNPTYANDATMDPAWPGWIKDIVFDASWVGTSNALSDLDVFTYTLDRALNSLSNRTPSSITYNALTGEATSSINLLLSGEYSAESGAFTPVIGVKLIAPDLTEVTLTNTDIVFENSYVTLTNTGTLTLSAENTSPVPTWSDGLLPTVRSWHKIVYGNGMFVQITDSVDKILTSSDGEVWTERNLPTSLGYIDVVFGNGLFVIVNYGTNVVTTSPDGITWTDVTIPASLGWIGATFGNGVFVIIAFNTNTAITSPDGITWTQRTLADTAYWTAVTYGNGKFVAISASGTSVSTSPDGVNWAISYLPSAQDWRNITFGNGIFVAVPNGNTNVFATSLNGITWTQRVLPITRNWIGIAYGGELFMIISTNSTSVLVSVDGITWIETIMPLSSSWKCLAYGNGTFLVTSNLGKVARYNTAKSRLTWIQALMPETGVWRSVAYGNSVFVAVLYNSAVAATSPDGVTWTPRTLPISRTWQTVSYGNGVFVAIAASSNIVATSPDGITWTQGVMPVDNWWYTSTFGNGVFVAICHNGNIAATSPDGVTWTQITLPIGNTWQDVAFGNGVFVAIANASSSVIVSSDGTNWVTQSLPSALTWYSLTFGNGLFVAVSYGTNNISTSPDGVTWINRYLPSGTTWYKICFGNGRFIINSINTNLLAKSYDGINWELETLNTSAARGAMAFGNSTFVIMQDSSKIMDAYAPTNLLMTHPTFMESKLPLSANWFKVVFGNNRFVTVGYGTNKSAVSLDGIKWILGNLPVVGNWISVAYGNGVFVAISSASAIAATSLDGVIWTQQTLPVTDNWRSMAFGNGLFVVVSITSDVTVTSPDGITWTQRAMPSSSPWVSITFNINLFVAVTWGSTVVATSPDGITWTAGSTGLFGYWYGPAFGNGVFVLVGNNFNNALTSPDGITWTQRSMVHFSTWRAVFFSNNLFIAVATNLDMVATSPDGINWTIKTLVSISNWLDIAYGNGVFVITSNGDSVEVYPFADVVYGYPVNIDNYTFRLENDPSVIQYDTENTYFTTHLVYTETTVSGLEAEWN